jgi:hypothetical protein
MLELTRYERVVFINENTVINRGLEGVWEDKGSWPEWGVAIPKPEEGERICERFCLLRPSMELFQVLPDRDVRFIQVYT